MGDTTIMRAHTVKTALLMLLLLGVAFGHEEPVSDAVVPERPVDAEHGEVDPFDEFMESTARWGISLPTWTDVVNVVTSVVDAVVAVGSAAWEAIKSTATAGVNAIIGKVNDMAKPSSGTEATIVTLGKAAKDTLGTVFTEVSNALKVSVEENMEAIQMHQRNRVAIRAKTGVQPLALKIPDPKTLKFDISSPANWVSWDNKEYNMDVPTELSVVANYLKKDKLVELALKISAAGETLNTGFKEFTKLKGSDFTFEDSLLKGPACSIPSEGLQFTVSAGAGFSSGVGAEAAIEVGFAVGCMENWGGSASGGKRWAIVPLWGFGLGVSVGVASPGASIDGNLYHYKPWAWFEAFGHEVSLGVSVGIGLVGVGADQIYGCCSLPSLGSGAGPIMLEAKNEDTFWWPFSLKDTRVGEHVAIQIIGTEEELVQASGKKHKVKNYQDLKFFSPTSGAEIDISGKAPAITETAVDSKVKTDENGLLEITVVAAYARCCRHFDITGNGFKACFAKFN